MIKPILVEQTLKLRHEVLRPHQTLADCLYPGDDDPTTIHLGLFVEELLSGIVSLYKRDCTGPHCAEELLKQPGLSYQIRAMAIAPEKQAQGLGMSLLMEAEQYAVDNKAKYLWANARTSARGFYQKAGYRAGQHEFIIAGIGPHVIVCKGLSGK